MRQSGYAALFAKEFLFKSFKVDFHERLKPIAMHLIKEGYAQDVTALKLLASYCYQLQFGYRLESTKDVESMMEVAQYAVQMAPEDAVKQTKKELRGMGVNPEEMKIFQIQQQKKLIMRR